MTDEEFNFDLKKGGEIDHGNGVVVNIPPHSQREFLAVLGKTVYEFLYYEEEQEGEDPSDRIHVLITDHKGGVTGMLMNVQDALIFQQGLAICMQRAVDDGVPLLPADE